MRIGIDARFFGPFGKGLGRYTQKLIEGLERVDAENQYVIFLRRENWNDYLPKRPNFKKVLAPFHWYTVKEQVMMPSAIAREKVNLMHFPHFNIPVFYSRKFVVTIHDLILLRFPTKKATTLGPLKYKIKELGYKLAISRAIRKAEKIITVSNFTKQDIVNYFKTSPDKISVTYEGVDLPEPDGQNQDVLKKYNISQPYILYVGNVYPHKNIESLLIALKKMDSSNHQELKDLRLVIVCKHDFFLQRAKEQAEKLGIARKVTFTGYVPDSDLGLIYKNAAVYVFPSFYEGFGLPPLEAMAQGVPVVSSQATSMPEIMKDAALYFNPGNPDEIVELVKSVVSDNNLRQKMAALGRELIKEYNWDTMAKETVGIYKNSVKRM